MPQSLSKVLIHLIFSTKNRAPFLKDPQHRDALIGYLIGILKNLECPSLIVNGVEDHIHILCGLSRNITLAQLVEEIKRSSSRWAKTHDASLRDFYWQNGYAAFSVSESGVPAVRRYIENQAEHHRRVSFQDELRAFFHRHNVEFDERYVWD